MSTTLRDLRVRVADLLGEVVVGDATAATPSPASTLTDAINLMDDKNHFRGADLLIVDGPSAGHRARVTASSLDSQTITFSPASVNGIDVGNEYQVFGVRSNMRIQWIDRALRSVQNDAFPAFRLPHEEVLGDLYYPTIDPEVTIPADFTHIHTVMHQGYDLSWHEVRPGKYNTGGWQLLPGRKLILAGRARNLADATHLRLIGYRREPDLVLDTDTTDIDPEWMVATATLYIRLGQGGQENMARAGMIGGRADALRSINITPIRANTRKVIP